MGFEGMRKGIKHIPGPEGVRGRNSDNKLILEKLGWEPTIRLEVREGAVGGRELRGAGRGGAGVAARPHAAPACAAGPGTNAACQHTALPIARAHLPTHPPRPPHPTPPHPTPCAAGRPARDVPLDQGRAGEGGQGAGQGHQVGWGCGAAGCRLEAGGWRAAARGQGPSAVLQLRPRHRAALRPARRWVASRSGPHPCALPNLAPRSPHPTHQPAPTARPLHRPLHRPLQRPAASTRAPWWSAPRPPRSWARCAPPTAPRASRTRPPPREGAGPSPSRAAAPGRTLGAGRGGLKAAPPPCWACTSAASGGAAVLGPPCLPALPPGPPALPLRPALAPQRMSAHPRAHATPRIISCPAAAAAAGQRGRPAGRRAQPPPFSHGPLPTRHFIPRALPLLPCNSEHSPVSVPPPNCDRCLATPLPRLPLWCPL